MSLFEEFKAVSADEWKQKIQSELSNSNDNLISEIESIKVQPFYTKEDISDLKIESSARNAWLKLTTKPDLLNFADGLYLKNESDLPKEFNGKKVFLELNDFENGLNNENNSTLVDLFGRFEQKGIRSKDEQESEIEKFQTDLKSNPNAKILVDGSFYQNNGATTVEQLAFILLKANEYITQFGSEFANRTVFKVAVGGNYLFEIAKIKGLRILWNLIQSEYNLTPKSTFIFAENSNKNKTEVDIENNIIRSMLEVASAIQGGCDAFIAGYKNNSFEETLLKQQVLLEQESYFHQFKNAIDGSYSIESLTNEICEKALQLFKEYEQKGGFLECLNDNTIQQKIEESHRKELKAIEEQKIVLVGKNKYQKS